MKPTVGHGCDVLQECVVQDDQDSGRPDRFPAIKAPSHFAGQALFVKGEDWHNNAMLGWTPFRWDIYAAGYKDAADVLITALAAQKAPIDSVIYPLVFLYRQGLELKLKLILPLARSLVGGESINDQKHFLSRYGKSCESTSNNSTNGTTTKSWQLLRASSSSLAPSTPLHSPFAIPPINAGR